MVSVQEIVGLIEGVATDTTVPKNIRRALEEAKSKLVSSDELTVKLSSAIYSIESVSEDVNMPPHARMQIWNILSALESIKK
jgi:hypothetical protein